MKNIVLIGMPGAGKSTVGVVLAKMLLMRFVDGDLLIQEEQGQKLQDIIDAHGNDYFLKIENETLARLQAENSIISPGGSIVYGKEAMAALKKNGIIVYLKLSYPEIMRRLGDISQRGIALGGRTMQEIYEERVPLYEAYADVIVSAENLTLTETVDKVIEEIKAYGTK